VRWDGTDDHGATVSSGVYLYRVSAGNETQHGKMVLLK
jgi:flagellar hook assembly protein FlgD